MSSPSVKIGKTKIFEFFLYFYFLLFSNVFLLSVKYVKQNVLKIVEIIFLAKSMIGFRYIRTILFILNRSLTVIFALSKKY
jgi:hypothetical protein